MSGPVFKRVLLKLSGEALMGGLDYGTDPARVVAIAAAVRGVVESGVQLAIVPGGGNIYRGLEARPRGWIARPATTWACWRPCSTRSRSRTRCEKQGVHTRVQSAITVQEVAEPYIRRRAMRHLEKGRVVIFAAGTGNPFFTTDTAAALRALRDPRRGDPDGQERRRGRLQRRPGARPDAEFIPRSRTWRRSSAASR